MDFWSIIQLNVAMGIRDYYRDKAREEEKKKDYYHNVIVEIADESAALGKLALSVFQKANPNVMLLETAKGAHMLPFYCFSLALQMQRGPITKEQNIVLDMFCRTMNLGFDKKQFLSDNAVSKKIYDTVGITMNHMGTFWGTFFKGVYVTNESPEILEKLANHMTGIVMRFAHLGKVDLHDTLPMCENFLKILASQAINAHDLPESEIDYMGEASYLEHKRRAELIAKRVVREAGDEEELDIDDMLPFFFMSLLYELIDSAKGSLDEKGEILNYAISKCEIQTGFDGKDIFHQMKFGGEMKQGFENVMNGALPVITIASVRANRMDDSPEFMKECTNFLIGVEKTLAAKYRWNGFGQLATKLMSRKLETVMQYMRA